MPTGAEVRQEVGRILNAARVGPGSSPVYLPVTSRGDWSSEVVVADDVLGSELYTAQAFQGYYAREADGSGVAPHGEKTRATILSSGWLAVSPIFSALLAVGDLVELWHPDVDPDVVDAARDRALAYRCTRWRRVPLNYLRDGDLQDEGTAAWTTVGATFAKSRLAGVVFQERFGTLSTTASWGSASQELAVRGGAVWTYGALVRARQGTAALVIRDVTNATDLAVAQWTGGDFGLLRGSVTLPEGCERLAVRLAGAEAGALVDWAWVALYPQDATLFRLPERVRRRSQVGVLYRLEGEAWPEVHWLPLPRAKVRGEAPLVQVLPEPPGEALLFWDELVHYLPLQAGYHTPEQRREGDVAVTPCPLEYVAAATLYELFPAQFEGLYRRRHAEFGARPVPHFYRELLEGVGF